MTKRQTLEQKIAEADSDGVCAIIRARIRHVFGNEVEDGALVYASHGNYHVQFSAGDDGEYQETLSRKGVAAYVRGLRKGK